MNKHLFILAVAVLLTQVPVCVAQARAVEQAYASPLYTCDPLMIKVDNQPFELKLKLFEDRPLDGPSTGALLIELESPVSRFDSETAVVVGETDNHDYKILNFKSAGVELKIDRMVPRSYGKPVRANAHFHREYSLTSESGTTSVTDIDTDVVCTYIPQQESAGAHN